MNDRIVRYIVVAWLMSTCGCALFQPAATPASAGQAAKTTSAAYIQRARRHEDRHELQQAMMAWQVAAQLDKKNARIPAAIAALDTRIANEAKIHFKKGLTHYRSKQYNAARTEFLKTIRLDPHHNGANDYLKTRLHRMNQTTYRVKQGDSYSKIAARTYKDARKAYLIAYFNDRNPHKPLLTGTILHLPSLAPRVPDRRKQIPDLRKQIPDPRKQINDWLSQARAALDQKQYKRVLALTARINPVAAGHPDARRLSKELADAANYALGKQWFDKGNAAKAVTYLNAVDKSYQDTGQLLSLALARMRAQAETHYRKGVKHFINEDLERAVKAWKRALSLNPNHPKARQDIENARRLLKKWKAIEK